MNGDGMNTGPEQVSAVGALYDAAYYESHCGPVPYRRSEPQWAAIFGTIAEHLIRAVEPRRVLDVGCALGFLVEAFWDRGVEAWGMDISRYAIENVRPDMRGYCLLRSAADGIPNGPFDLIACIEVLEHMPEQEGLRTLAHMANATNTILFSSSPYDFDEPTHANVRPHMYWLNAFQERGFSPDILFDAGFVAPQAMLLRRQPVPLPVEVLRLFAGTLDLRHRLAQLGNEVNTTRAELASAREAERLIREDLDAAAGNISAFLDRGNGDPAFAIESRLRTLENQVAQTAAAVSSIIDSRIWRTLVRGAAAVQKLLPGSRRNS